MEIGANGHIPVPEVDKEEQQLDNKDFFDWDIDKNPPMQLPVDIIAPHTITNE
jgi:hypothetical protein